MNLFYYLAQKTNMDRTFKSKVDWWYHLVMAMMAVACVSCILSQNIAATIATVAATMLMLHIFFNTYYVITGNGMLLLHCSIFPEKKIAIHEIEALESSMLPISSYALSLSRIIIWKEGCMWMLVSPVNRDEFVQLLKKVNPNIKLNKTQLTDEL